jgi:hypothetical protein
MPTPPTASPSRSRRRVNNGRGLGWRSVDEQRSEERDKQRAVLGSVNGTDASRGQEQNPEDARKNVSANVSALVVEE